MVDLRDLELFVVLAESPHMTRAAEGLHSTQPTLSRTISRLEHELGAPLFDRIGRRLRLNASGEVLLQHARWSCSYSMPRPNTSGPCATPTMAPCGGESYTPWRRGFH